MVRSLEGNRLDMEGIEAMALDKINALLEGSCVDFSEEVGIVSSLKGTEGENKEEEEDAVVVVVVGNSSKIPKSGILGCFGVFGFVFFGVVL